MAARAIEKDWRLVAEERGGCWVEGVRFGPRDAVLLPHRRWTIRVDSEFNAAVKVDVVRIRAACAAVDGFRFSFHRRRWYSGMATALGMQDVVVGQPGFDEEFIVRGSDEARLRALCAIDGFRRRLEGAGAFVLTATAAGPTWQPPQGAGALELRVDIGSRRPDRSCIEDAADLLGDTLDALLETGAAVAQPPTLTRCAYCEHQLVAQAVCPECGRRVLLAT